MICINSITICPENITITKGKWYHGAYAQVCPTNATCQCVTWHSSNPNVANVNQNGYIFGVSEGSAVIYATAQDGSGAVGFCNGTVVSPVKVSSVTVTPSTKTVNVGDTFCLSATVCPTNAEDKRIRWTSCDCSIADVDYLTGCVTAKSAGTTCICANAIDGSGVQGCCEVTILPLEAACVKLNKSMATLSKGKTVALQYSVYPYNATITSVNWNSDSPYVASVSNGVVTAKNDGVANITVTINGKLKATCKVTVDSREKVIVQKDGDYFKIIFADGLVWKSVGRDLSLDENISGNLGYGYLEWDNLYEWEQRFLDNFQNSYTDDQLAYIYYFDPLGVEDYMVNTQAPVYNNKTMLERLNFKDSLYNKIFGIIPNKFYFNEDGEYDDYQNHIGWDRLEYYSNAEILFGWHRAPFDWNSVLEAALSTLFDLVISLIPPISYIQDGVTLYKYAFYGASINEFSTSLLTYYFSLYEASPITWVISLLSAIADATFSQFEIPNDMTVDVYCKVESLENYRTVFIIGGTEVSMSDVIVHC